MKTQQEYLKHIRDCIEIIQQYTVGGRASLDDTKTRDAVIRRLQIMAESCLRLSNDIQDSYPNVGWQHIRNFRNRLVHEYLDVDINLIWTVVERNLPPLSKAVESELSQRSRDDDDRDE